jgi:uncharacterized membrane protein
VNSPEKLSHERYDVIEMRLEQPVAAGQDMEFGIRQIAEIGSR